MLFQSRLVWVLVAVNMQTSSDCSSSEQIFGNNQSAQSSGTELLPPLQHQTSIGDLSYKTESGDKMDFGIMAPPPDQDPVSRISEAVFYFPSTVQLYFIKSIKTYHALHLNLADSLWLAANLGMFNGKNHEAGPLDLCYNLFSTFLRPILMWEVKPCPRHNY